MFRTISIQTLLFPILMLSRILIRVVIYTEAKLLTRMQQFYGPIFLIARRNKFYVRRLCEKYPKIER